MPETPEDVPAELINALLEAANDACVEIPHFEASRLLAAVLPVHRAMARAEFADEVMEVLGGAPDHATALLRLAGLLGEAKDAARGEQP